MFSIINFFDCVFYFFYTSCHSQCSWHFYIYCKDFFSNKFSNEEVSISHFEDTKNQKNNLVTKGTAHKNDIFSSTFLCKYKQNLHALSLPHSYNFLVFTVAATPPPLCSLAETPLRTFPSQLHCRLPPGQQLPLKSCTIEKKLFSYISIYLPLHINHIKTSLHRVTKQPQIFYVIHLWLVIDIRYYYYTLDRGGFIDRLMLL